MSRQGESQSYEPVTNNYLNNHIPNYYDVYNDVYSNVSSTIYDSLCDNMYSNLKQAYKTNINNIKDKYDNTTTHFWGFMLVYYLTQGESAALSILIQLQDKFDDIALKEIYGKFILHQVTGKRLAYIYTNECYSDIDTLINAELSLFTAEYFIKCKNHFHY